MNKIKTTHLAFVTSLLFLLSCQKDDDPPANKIPEVNAGPSLSTTLPTDSITVTGSASDADGHIVAYLWSQSSGPSGSFIVNPGSASTKIHGLKPGTYVFQLMATDDDGATAVDTTSVIVNPAQIQTITLQPENNPNEFQYLDHNGTYTSGSGASDIPIEAWTSGSTPYTVREAIKFDLSGIPTNSTIISANLYLYSYPSPTLNGNFVDANFGTDNTMLVQQIISNWSPATSNWLNQPATSTTNQIVVPSTSQSNLDLNLDVTNMISSMVNGNANYGFFLKIQNEVYYNCRIFVSSYNTSYSSKHPKLVVVYQ
ncbi:MAG TPA: DNRLRE domain-containing protein [Chitinophagaceae bacterium]|jgi:K319-like protein|nr:DNRLRE domain-containing protein [Chitinophagaceae bacterium]